MLKWLSQEWLDEQRNMAKDQPERPGASARLQYVVTGGPIGDIEYYWVVEDGKIIESQLGHLDDGEITLTMSYDDAMKIQKSELSSTAAFMRGKVKVRGKVLKFKSLLPITNSPEYKQLLHDVTAITDF
jgi:putative sterol carrier protein